MSKKHLSGLLCVLTAVILATGCNHIPKRPPGYFHTPFQTESQFIIEAIVTDLAEQMYYAANHRLPPRNYFYVMATEKPGSPIDTPVFTLQIGLDSHASLTMDVNVYGPIWSPAVYHDLAAALGKAIGLGPDPKNETSDTQILSDLLDGKAETLERDNESLSYELEANFGNSELHEQAALVLGAFALREHSGSFFEIRSPLSRLTAHLAMSRYLSGADAFGVNGQLAEAIMLTLANDEAPALEELKTVETNNTDVAAMVRALQARSTGDFRPLTRTHDRSQVESVAWFAAMADYNDTASAWLKLDDDQKQTIDFVRVAYEESYSVGMGNDLLRVAIPLELQEIGSVFELSHQRKLAKDEMVDALNALPERCFYTGPDQKTHVRVIGWGQWAAFLQRQLCHAMQQDFYLMEYDWGTPDDARTFSTNCDSQFSGLRLYPFVRRFNCTDEKSYHQSEDDGIQVTVATPQLVPAMCWNYLCYSVSFAPQYLPVPDPHVNEWFNHNPPPGTDYDLNPRLNHPSLVDRGDAVACFERLHELAPCDCRISRFLVEHKYHNNPTYEQAMDLYQGLLPYSVTALRAVANTVTNEPDRYENYLLQAAALDPSFYYDLADYAWRYHQEDKAVQYVDKGCDTDPDSVRVANHAEWRVRYYLKKAQIEKARAIADFAGEVYSYAGLQAKAVFMEETASYDDAFAWYAKIEERYNDSRPLVAFCQRYKLLTGDTKFDAELQKRVSTVFPKGMENVSLGDFSTAPADGVLIREQNDRLTAAGLKQGDVIVAIGGNRVHNYEQYAFIRDSQPSPELDLIVWQGSSYNEIKSSPPHHLFGVPFDDYTRN